MQTFFYNEFLEVLLSFTNIFCDLFDLFRLLSNSILFNT